MISLRAGDDNDVMPSDFNDRVPRERAKIPSGATGRSVITATASGSGG
jgi:hypothetical protein